MDQEAESIKKKKNRTKFLKTEAAEKYICSKEMTWLSLCFLSNLDYMKTTEERENLTKIVLMDKALSSGNT